MARPARPPYGAWPRGLNRFLAALYTGVSENKFQAEVKARLWPEPEERGRRKIWDRHEIDKAWDQRHEAEGDDDPLMEALHKPESMEIKDIRVMSEFRHHPPKRRLK